MNWKIAFVLLYFPLLTIGCGSKDNFVILSPSGDGQVGALEIETEKGSAVLDEQDKAIFISSRKSIPSEPTAVNPTETRAHFREALQILPLRPKRFILYFKHDSEQLTEGSEQLIPAIVEEVRQRQSGDIFIIGNTDRMGEDSYNRILTMERAQVVYDLLREQNINGEEMTILYHGEGNPLIPTAGGVAEPRNRRVEVVVR